MVFPGDESIDVPSQDAPCPCQCHFVGMRAAWHRLPVGGGDTTSKKTPNGRETSSYQKKRGESPANLQVRKNEDVEVEIVEIKRSILKMVCFA